MAVRSMSVFRQGTEDYTINDPNVADEFSTSQNYAVGDYAYYQGNLYRFTTAHSAGAWNSGHVTAAKVCDDIKSNKEKEESDIENLENKVTNGASVADPSISNSFIKAPTGVVTGIDNTEFAVTDFIWIDGVYAVTLDGNLVTNPAIGAVAFYKDKSNTEASCISCTAYNGGKHMLVIVPNDAKYVRFGSNTTSNGTKYDVSIKTYSYYGSADLTGFSRKYFVPDFSSSEGEYINRSGYIIPIENYPEFKVSKNIAIPSGYKSIRIRGNVTNNPSMLAVAFYLKSPANGENFISGVYFGGEEVNVPIPRDAKIAVFDRNVNSNGIYVGDLTYEFVADEYEASVNDSLAGQNVKIFTPDFSNSEGEFINPINGSIATVPGYPGFKVSVPIEIPDDAMFVSLRGDKIGGNQAILAIGFYTSNIPSAASFISGVPYLGHEYDAPIPLEAKYVVFSNNVTTSGNYLGDVTYQFVKNKYIQQIKNAAMEDSADGARLKVPTAYDLITGDTMELFYKGIISSWKDDGYLIEAECEIGSNYKKRFIVTPGATGTKTLTLKLYDSEMKVKDIKDIQLRIHATPGSPSVQKNILCVGDSLTAPGIWPLEMKRRLTGSGGTPAGFNLSNLNFIGSCSHDGVNYEGYGGWTFDSFNTANENPEFKLITCTHDKIEAQDQHSIYKDGNNNQWKIETVYDGSLKIILTSGSADTFPSTGTLTWVSGGVNHSDIVYTASENAPGNPFWDDTEEKVDFGTYAERMGVSSIDYVFVLLGWNSASITKAAYKTKAQTFIDNIKESFPDAKIVLMGLQVPARDGMGLNYGANGTYSKYVGLLDFIHNLDDWYDEIAGENTNVYHINISGQFDTEHNMPQSTRTVNIRNSETEVYQTNGVHPATSGYYQIADAAVRCISGLL